MASSHPSDAAQIAKLAAHLKWAKCDDRTTATAAARKAFLDRFEREVDPDGTLDPADRATRAAHAKSAYYARLALKSAQARRAKATARKAEQPAGGEA
ncbi:hypothetical protein V6U90_08125 [Micromonospora sp. CPCC 206060]|uniref:hypothetical protein n=1 Tax=Micromonospora sp. CPCC 206060 TaxID=3122406 RepID=UPI002FEEE020